MERSAHSGVAFARLLFLAFRGVYTGLMIPVDLDLFDIQVKFAIGCDMEMVSYSK